MNPRAEMPEIDPTIAQNAVSVFGQDDAYGDFPVLKAFQQYIDAEQTKARKRMLMLCVFFGAMMFIVIAVFVGLLVTVTSRNQSLNDRLLDAMMDRYQRTEQPPVAAVDRPQPTTQQDATAILALTAKLEEMQKQLAENKVSAEKAAAEPAKPKGPTPEELEIARLKALLATEREKMAVEREKQRQAELEEYRRKHYPELYEKKEPVKEDVPERRTAKVPEKSANDELLEEVDQILNESKTVRYFDDDEEDEIPTRKKASVKRTKSSPPPSPKEYSIPVDIRGSSSRWNVPNE